MSIEKKTYAEVDIIRLQVIAVKKYLLMEKKTSFIWNQLTINKSFFMFSCHLLQISNRTLKKKITKIYF